MFNKNRFVSIFFLSLFFTANLKSSSRTLLESPDIKILVLIIASDQHYYYVLDQDTWRSYMHFNRARVESYFIKANPNLAGDYLIDGDVIWSKTQENYAPGILNKTVLSMAALASRLDEFEYVIRTNLSSFYHFPRLLEFLKTAPKQGFYCGVVYGFRFSPSGIPDFDFVSGDGIILSRDLVKMMIEDRSELLHQKVADDVLIAEFLFRRGIKPVRYKRMECTNRILWDKNKENIPDTIFQFRVKNDNQKLRETEEVFIQRELVNMFYYK